MVLLRMLVFRPREATATRQAPPAARKGKSVHRESAEPTKKTGSAPAARTIEPDLAQWDKTVEQIGLGGVARQLANNCVFNGFDGKELQLSLDPVHRNLHVGSSVQRLAKALESFLGRPLKLKINVREAPGETPARIEEKRAAKRQLDAEAAMSDDPLVRALDDAFGGKLVPGSVRPLDK